MRRKATECVLVQVQTSSPTPAVMATGTSVVDAEPTQDRASMEHLVVINKTIGFYHDKRSYWNKQAQVV